MAKSYLRPATMYRHLEPHVGDPLDYTQEDLATELETMFWVEFPSADGFPTVFPGQPDYTEIARILQDYAALETGDLGIEWLSKMAEAAATEDPATAVACNKRLEEIEADLDPEYLHGLAVALDWALAREKEFIENAQSLLE